MASPWLLLPSAFYGLTLSRKRYVIPRSCQDLWEGDRTIGQHLITQGMQVDSRFISLEEFEDIIVNPSAPGANVIHSFEWLWHLKALGHNTGRKMARYMLQKWLSTHNRQSYSDPHFEAGILGYRLSNWCALYSFFGATADDSFQKALNHSFSQQLHHLDRISLRLLAPERRLMALKGLIIGLPASPKRYTRLLERTISELILPDGSHRNSALHLITLRDLIELQYYLKIQTGLIPQAIEKMAGALRYMRCQQGLLCPFVTPSPLFLASSHAIDAVLSLTESSNRPPEHLSRMGLDRLAGPFGLFFIHTKAKSKPAFQGGSGIFEWTFQSSNQPPLLMSDVCIETGTIEYSVQPYTRYVKKNTGLIWQGRQLLAGHLLSNQPLYIERDICVGSQMCRGFDRLSQKSGKIRTRFHIAPQARLLETPGQIEYGGRVWEIHAKSGHWLWEPENHLAIIESDSNNHGIRWVLR